MRRLAARWLDEVEGAGGIPAAIATERALLEGRDRRLLLELVQGTLRWRARIDHVLAAAAGRPIGRIDAELRAPLRVAAYQLLFLDRVPSYAVVSEAVDEARRRSRRSAGFANAVLRRIGRAPRLGEWPVDLRDPVERLAVETSHPRFLVERWTRALGEERAREVLDANNRRAGYQLLAFRDRGGRDALAARLADEGVETSLLSASPLGLAVESGDPLSTRAYEEGDFYVQDQASQMAAWVPLPRGDEEVLDAASAPGGKSFALMAAEPSIRITAADAAPARLATVAENCRRLRREVRLVAADARRPPFARRFDRVVADLPCSGTGILARHPDLKWRLSESEIGRLAGDALELLRGLADRVRPGGLLVAITCSIEAEENEAVIARLLARSPELEPADLEELLEPARSAPVFGTGAWRLLPAAQNDGFTVHVLRRKGGSG